MSTKGHSPINTRQINPVRKESLKIAPSLYSIPKRHKSKSRHYVPSYSPGLKSFRTNSDASIKSTLNESSGSQDGQEHGRTTEQFQMGFEVFKTQQNQAPPLCGTPTNLDGVLFSSQDYRGFGSCLDERKTAQDKQRTQMHPRFPSQNDHSRESGSWLYGQKGREARFVSLKPLDKDQMSQGQSEERMEWKEDSMTTPDFKGKEDMNKFDSFRAILNMVDFKLAEENKDMEKEDGVDDKKGREDENRGEDHEGILKGGIGCCVNENNCDSSRNHCIPPQADCSNPKDTDAIFQKSSFFSQYFKEKASDFQISKPEQLQFYKLQDFQISKPQDFQISKPQVLQVPRPQDFEVPKPQLLQISKPEELKFSEPQDLPGPQELQISEPEEFQDSKEKISSILTGKEEEETHNALYQNFQASETIASAFQEPSQTNDELFLSDSTKNSGNGSSNQQTGEERTFNDDFQPNHEPQESKRHKRCKMSCLISLEPSPFIQTGPVCNHPTTNCIVIYDDHTSQTPHWLFKDQSDVPKTRNQENTNETSKNHDSNPNEPPPLNQENIPESSNQQPFFEIKLEEYEEPVNEPVKRQEDPFKSNEESFAHKPEQEFEPLPVHAICQTEEAESPSQVFDILNYLVTLPIAREKIQSKLVDSVSFTEEAPFQDAVKCDKNKITLIESIVQESQQGFLKKISNPKFNSEFVQDQEDPGLLGKEQEGVSETKYEHLRTGVENQKREHEEDVENSFVRIKKEVREKMAQAVEVNEDPERKNEIIIEKTGGEARIGEKSKENPRETQEEADQVEKATGKHEMEDIIREKAGVSEEKSTPMIVEEMVKAILSKEIGVDFAAAFFDKEKQPEVSLRENSKEFKGKAVGKCQEVQNEIVPFENASKKPKETKKNRKPVPKAKVTAPKKIDLELELIEPKRDQKPMVQQVIPKSPNTKNTSSTPKNTKTPQKMLSSSKNRMRSIERSVYLTITESPVTTKRFGDLFDAEVLRKAKSEVEREKREMEQRIQKLQTSIKTAKEKQSKLGQVLNGPLARRNSSKDSLKALLTKKAEEKQETHTEKSRKLEEMRRRVAQEKQNRRNTRDASREKLEGKNKEIAQKAKSEIMTFREAIQKAEREKQRKQQQKKKEIQGVKERLKAKRVELDISRKENENASNMSRISSSKAVLAELSNLQTQLEEEEKQAAAEFEKEYLESREKLKQNDQELMTRHDQRFGKLVKVIHLRSKSSAILKN